MDISVFYIKWVSWGMFPRNEQLSPMYRIGVHEGATDSSVFYRYLFYQALVFNTVFACIACGTTTRESGDSAIPQGIGQDTGIDIGGNSGQGVYQDSQIIRETAPQDAGEAGPGPGPTDGSITDTKVDPVFTDADTADTDAGLSDEEDENCPLKEVFPQFGTQKWNAIWGSASDDVYVIGDFGAVLHYDGNRWEKTVIDTDIQLLDIWGSGKNDIYIVGRTNSGDETTFHFAGSDWHEVRLDYWDNVPDSSVPFLGIDPTSVYWPIAVYGTSPQDVFITGSASILHFDGSSWKSVQSESALDPFAAWLDVFGCGPDQVYALGRSAGTRILFRFDRTSSHFKIQEKLSVAADKGFCTAEDDIWLIEYNRIAHWNGQEWNTFDREALGAQPTSGFENVFVTPDDRRFLVGINGALFYSDSSSFRQVVTGTDSDLAGLWASDKNHIYAVGENGVILSGNVDHLDFVYPIFNSDIRTLLKLESDRVAVIGLGGSGVEVAMGIENDWQIVARADLDSFVSSFGANIAVGTRADDIIIGGTKWQNTPAMPSSEPTLFHFDGQRFEEVGITISSDHVGLACTGLKELRQINDEVFAVCDNGEILRREGAVFRSLSPWSICSMDRSIEFITFPSPTPTWWTISSINIWGDDPNNLFIWGTGTQPSGGPFPIATRFGCHYDGAVWTHVPNDVGVRAVWGGAGEIYLLFVDESDEVEFDSCAISIMRFDGVATTLAAGCDPEAEQVFEPNSMEWVYSGPGDSFFVPLTDGALYYDGIKWRVIPFENGLRDSYWTSHVVFSETDMYMATSDRRIYHLTCPAL